MGAPIKDETELLIDAVRQRQRFGQDYNGRPGA